MTVQISLIGLGQIGASVGLCLANRPDLVKRIGHDKQPAVMQKAKQIGAVDRIERNLIAAVREADLVFLSLPLDQIRPTLEYISQDLIEGAIVMDTAPVKEVVRQWAKDILPPKRHYIGLTPVLNPAYLHDIYAGIESAHSDLFQRGLIAITTTADTDPQAIKLAADLTRLLGAIPLFADQAEMDGMLASTNLLPSLLAAALLNATVNQPGWADGRKIAGRGYAEATGPMALLPSPAALAEQAIYNQENALRVIDGLTAALQSIRNDIQKSDEKSLVERLERAQKGRENWWKQRQVADWLSEEMGAQPETPKTRDILGNLVGFRRKPKS